MSCINAIDSEAFRNCPFLLKVSLPSTLTSIGKSVFEGCRELDKIKLPDSVTVLGKTAFLRCPNISISYRGKTYTRRNIEKLYEKFEKYTCSDPFDVDDDGVLDKYNGSEGNITVPRGVTRIGTCAFCDCENLKSITLPKDLQTLGEKAFAQCTELTSVSVPDSVSEIEEGKNVFEGCNKISVSYKGNIYTQSNMAVFLRFVSRNSLCLKKWLIFNAKYA